MKYQKKDIVLTKTLGNLKSQQKQKITEVSKNEKFEKNRNYRSHCFSYQRS